LNSLSSALERPPLIGAGGGSAAAGLEAPFTAVFAADFEAGLLFGGFGLDFRFELTFA